MSQNAEIVLGTVTNLSSAKKWLSGTFLYVRLRENPEHYRIDGDNGNSRLEERLERIASRDIELLQQHKFVLKGDSKFSSTELGEAMARYCVHFETAKQFLGLPPKAKMSEIVRQLEEHEHMHPRRLIVSSSQRWRKLKSSKKFDSGEPRNPATRN
jgi:ATP-dependent DNA helicase HFM1/MER3